MSNWRSMVRCWVIVLLICAGAAAAQNVNVSARVLLVNGAKRVGLNLAGEAVLWLVPLDAAAAAPKIPDSPHPQLVQRNKSFEPHLLVVPVGSLVDFPNRDPFFHNVFSLFEGKRFDLGLYEAGTSREVHFDKPGISYIFCDIHPEMSAVVIALPTPYYGISNLRGLVEIPNVPSGRYSLHVWYEDALPEQLHKLTREVEIAEGSSSLGIFRLTATQLRHKNKYGQDYDPPSPDSPAYARP